MLRRTAKRRLHSTDAVDWLPQLHVECYICCIWGSGTGSPPRTDRQYVLAIGFGQQGLN